MYRPAVPLLIAMLFSFLTLMEASPVGAAVRNLSPREANQILDGNADIYLLDVRTPGEYRDSRLPGARLIPIDQVQQRLGEIPADRPILIYCAVGSRSGQVAAFLDRLGYRNIFNLYGGIWGWRLGGYPVLKGGP